MATTPSSPIDLYIVDLVPGDTQVKRLTSILSREEEERAARLIVPAASNRFRVARATLRQILSTYTRVAPEQVTFNYGPHGKPAIQADREPLFFNLSHTTNVGAIAVSRQFKVGVDVEAWRPVRAGVAERFFSKSEVKALDAFPGEERTAAFFRCWTRKEAVVKAMGDGLSRPLNSFDVTLSEVSQPQIMRIEYDERKSWTLFSFSPHPDVSGAVACRSLGAPVKLCLRSGP